MRHLIQLTAIGATVVCAVGAIAVCADGQVAQTDNEEAAVNSAFHEWETFIRHSVQLGATITHVDDVMTGRYRERGKSISFGSGGYTVYYVIDDFHELVIGVDAAQKVGLIRLRAKSGWIRFPNHVVSRKKLEM